MPEFHDPETRGGTDVLNRVEEDIAHDLPWQVLLWNDPVNTTDYVTLTLMRVMKLDKDGAERLMLLAHTDGKTAISHGTQNECQVIATALMSASLWATLEKVAA